jgi:hypothetical protein
MNLIDRNNYEEYFILYMDNELPVADKQMVELFMQENPDLKEELDLLMQFKLAPDNTIVFEGKEMLMKDEAFLQIPVITKKLLLHLDNELPAGEKASIEKLIAADSDVNKEWQLLQKTKLPAEAISFPYKESLYRKEETVRVVSIKWWRIAAAAVVLLGIGFGTYSILNKKGPVDGPDLVVINNKTENKTITPNNETGTKTISPVIQPPKEEIATAPENKTEQRPLLVKQNSITPIIKNDKKNNFLQQEQPLVVQANITDNKNEVPLFDKKNEEKNKTASDAVAINDKGNPSSQNFKEEGVTTDKSLRNTNTQAGNNPEVDRPVIVMSEPENSGKKNRLRGFFRKATRIFEHTTNISAANEDDRLLIGGLAVRLK